MRKTPSTLPLSVYFCQREIARQAVFDQHGSLYEIYYEFNA